MDAFFQMVSQFTPLSPESRQALAAHLKRLEFPKEHLLVRPDTTCHFVYFVESGLTRTFYYTDDGKDVTDWFSAEASFACSIISFISQKPDRRGIETLEPTVLYGLHHDALEALAAQHHEIETFFRKIVSSGILQVQQRFDELHFATARQRYQSLLQNRPALLQRAPLGMIASYLGITPETLSRMRAQR